MVLRSPPLSRDYVVKNQNTMNTAKRVESANALSLRDVYDRFIPSELKKEGSEPFTFKLPDSLTSTHTLYLETAETISKPNLTACFNLIDLTSSADYAASSMAWRPSRKRREMRLPDLRYLLVKSKAEIPAIEAFLSFMLTYEDGHVVVYCYEVHMVPSLQGKGLGRYLVGIMEQVGAKAGLEKAMLTVFVSNKGALGFYEKLGYTEDEYSPEPRKLRNGTVKMPDYVILSKALDASRQE